MSNLKSRIRKLEQVVGEKPAGGVVIYDNEGVCEHKGQIFRDEQVLRKQFPNAGWIFLPKKNERSYD